MYTPIGGMMGGFGGNIWGGSSSNEYDPIKYQNPDFKGPSNPFSGLSNWKRGGTGKERKAMEAYLWGGPKNAFDSAMMGKLQTSAIGNIQRQGQQANVGMANAMAARGGAGPNLAAMNAQTNAARDRSAVARTMLDAELQGLNVGLQQYGARNQGYSNLMGVDLANRKAAADYAMGKSRMDMEADMFNRKMDFDWYGMNNQNRMKMFDWLSNHQNYGAQWNSSPTGFSYQTAPSYFDQLVSGMFGTSPRAGIPFR